MLILLFTVSVYGQSKFRAEFNYLASTTPANGGDYALRGLVTFNDALGYTYDSLTLTTTYFVDAKGDLYQLVWKSTSSSPATLEVDRVGHSNAPVTGIGLLTRLTATRSFRLESSGISDKLRGINEVDLRLKVDTISGGGGGGADGNGLITALPAGTVVIDAAGNTLRLDTMATFGVMGSTSYLTKGRGSLATLATTPRNDINNGFIYTQGGGSYLHYTNGLTAANVQAFSTVAALRAFGQSSGTNVISYVKADSDGTAGLYSYDTTGATLKHQYVMDGDTGSLAGYVGGSTYYFMRTTNVDSTILFHNKYKIANATPPSDGAAYAMTWTNNIPSFTKVMSDTTYDAGNGAFVTASATGITFARTDSQTGTFTIPAGVTLKSGSIHHTAPQNPGSLYYIRFSFSGTRVTNNDIDDLDPPVVRVINKSSAVPSRTNPATFNLTSGSINLVARVTGVAPLEIKLENYNDSNVGGANESMIKFVF